MSDAAAVADTEDWIAVLREEARCTSIAKAAKRISYSTTTVSEILSGKYRADPAAIRQAVEGALMSATVECPALGMEIRTNQCLEFQRRKIEQATSPHHVRLFRTCPTCPHHRAAAGEPRNPVGRPRRGTAATHGKEKPDAQ